MRVKIERLAPQGVVVCAEDGHDYYFPTLDDLINLAGGEGLIPLEQYEIFNQTGKTEHIKTDDLEDRLCELTELDGLY